jgi:hypothetical protein
MKMTRNLIILGAVLVLAVALVIVAPMLKPAASPSASPTASAADPQLKLMALTADKVSEVTVENANQTYTVYKKGETLVVKDHEDMALDQTVATSLFFDVANVTGERLIEQTSAANLATYGLDKPQAKATAKYTDGTSAVFLLGNVTSTGNTYYLMKQGDPRVITIWMNVGTAFLANYDTLLEKEKINLTQEEIDTVKVLKDGKPALELTTVGVDSKVSISPWMIMQPWKRSVDGTELDTYLKAIVAVAVGDVVEGKPADLAKYGLDKPKFDITISGKGKSSELLVGSAKDDSYTYIKFADRSTVYVVPTSSLTFTGTSAYKLMDKMIILVNISSALGVEFKGLGQDGKLVINQKPSLDDKGVKKVDGNGNPMYDQTFTLDNKPVEDKVARYFYQTCIGLSTHSLVDEGWKPTSEAPVAVLTYYRNTDPTEIKIEFLPYDKDFYAVRMNGGTYFLITQEKVQKVADDMAKLKAGTLTVPQ